QLATVLDAGLTKRQDLYYVREYLPRSELFSIDPLIALRRLVSVVAFLSWHRQVHGGIKPSNIFVTNETFKLVDAKVGRQRSSDENVESVHFVAPEVLQGGAASYESDLYSLGAVLYRILTGRHLFEDEDPGRLRSKYLAAFAKTAPHSSTVSPEISEY